MTSDKMIAANRRNARRSTGPRTAAGKRKSAGNALRHGVTAGLHGDPAMDAAVARIAAALAGPGASPRRLALVRPVAEAQAEMLRARTARAALMDLAAAKTPAHAQREADAITRSLPSLVRLDGYERRAMGRRNRALRALRKSLEV
jgi:hypothetical protein